MLEVKPTAIKFSNYDLTLQFDPEKLKEANTSRLSLVDNWFEANVAEDDGGATCRCTPVSTASERAAQQPRRRQRRRHPDLVRL